TLAPRIRRDGEQQQVRLLVLVLHQPEAGEAFAAAGDGDIDVGAAQRREDAPRCPAPSEPLLDVVPRQLGDRPRIRRRGEADLQVGDHRPSLPPARHGDGAAAPAGGSHPRYFVTPSVSFFTSARYSARMALPSMPLSSTSLTHSFSNLAVRSATALTSASSAGTTSPPPFLKASKPAP